MKLTFWIVLISLLGNFAIGAKNLPDPKYAETQVVLGNIVNMITVYKHDCEKYPEALTSLQTNAEGCKNWGPEPYATATFQFRDAWGCNISYTPEKSATP